MTRNHTHITGCKLGEEVLSKVETKRRTTRAHVNDRGSSCNALESHADGFATQTLVHVGTAQGDNRIVVVVKTTTENLIASLNIVKSPSRVIEAFGQVMTQVWFENGSGKYA